MHPQGLGPEDPEHYFFVHLMKTGGTVIWMALQRAFGADALYPGPADRSVPAAQLDTDLLERVWPERRRTVRVISGHLPYCIGPKIEPGIRTFTVLRHPVDRMLSLMRSLPRQRADGRDGAQTLAEFYEQSVRRNPLAGNHMVRMLGMSATEMGNGLFTPIDVGAQHLQRAMANLEAVDVVGMQDDLDGFVAELDATFGWDLGPIGVGNVSAPASIPAGLAERIAEDDALDMALFRYAEELRRSRRSADQPHGRA